MSVREAKPSTKKVKATPPAYCYVCEKRFRRGESREIIEGRVRHIGCKPGSYRWNLSKWGAKTGPIVTALFLMLGGSFVVTDNNFHRDRITVKESPWGKNTWDVRNESTFEKEGTIRKSFDGSYRVYDKNGNQRGRIERRN